MKVGVALCGLGVLLGLVLVAGTSKADEDEPPPRPPPPVPSPIPSPAPSPPPYLGPEKLQEGAHYKLMISTTNGSIQEVTKLLTDEGFEVVTIREIIAQGSLRPPFDYVIDHAIWRSPNAIEPLSLMGDLARGHIQVTQGPERIV